MKNSILILIVFLAPVLCLAQNTPMYTWQEHLAYKNAKLILEVGERIYCATEIGLYYYHQNDYTINRINKINGLSEIKISAMAYDQENEIIIISYENCNVDLINKDGLVSIPDHSPTFCPLILNLRKSYPSSEDIFLKKEMSPAARTLTSIESSESVLLGWFNADLLQLVPS